MMGHKSSFTVEPNAEPVKTTTAKPGSQYNAPSVPQQATRPPAQTKLGRHRDMLSGIKGSHRPYKPTLKGNVGTAIVSAVAEPVIEPLGNFLGEKLADGLFDLFGGDSGFDDVDDYAKMRREVREADAKDARDAELVKNNDLTDAPPAPVLPSKAELDALESPKPVPERIRQAVESTRPPVKSEPEPRIKGKDDSRNSDYTRLRDALNKNSSKAERDAVRDAGLAKHKELFPQFYK